MATLVTEMCYNFTSIQTFPVLLLIKDYSRTEQCACNAQRIIWI